MSEWLLTYQGYDPEEEPLREALCTLGNGVLATRGAVPECPPGDPHYPGTYRIGLYDTQGTTIEGTTVENESLVNLPNWLDFTFRHPGGDWFTPDEAEILSYEQRLDTRQGILSRHLTFREGGRTTAVTQRRVVSMAQEHLAALETTFRAEDWTGTLEVRSGIDGRVRNLGVERYRQLTSDHLETEARAADEEGRLFLQARTLQSKVRIAMAARTRISNGGSPAFHPKEEEELVRHTFELELEEGESVTVEKTVAVYTSMDHAITESGEDARRTVEEAPDFESLVQAHALIWSQYWRRSEIRIGADDHTDSTVNLYLFHTLQTLSENTLDHDVGVPARGIHGEAYRGHVFWDELFVFPVLNRRFPELTRSLLKYRYRRLDAARRLAREAGYEGAMYPWQSGSNGEEESQTLHLNPRSGRWIPDVSRLQRHIGGAVVYSVWKYFQGTGDVEFMASYGAEIVLEVARFWSSIARYDRSEGRYVIEGVMGPDEYHTSYPDADEPGLRNNAYTNVLAVWCLRRGIQVLDILPGARRKELVERLGIHQKELDRWDDISRKMTIPFHGDGIISQFEGYEELEEFDWEGYREKYDDIQRLDRILEAEGDTPNRYKASKQADVLMLFYLFSDGELESLVEGLGYEWDPELVPRNIAYYTQRTSHGSTLSGVVHAWVLARVDRERTWDFFKRALESDICDIQGGTTEEGIHLGAMTGTVDLLQRGYSGLELRDGVLHLDPYLPADLDSLAFTVQHRDNWLEVSIDDQGVCIVSVPGSAGPARVAVGEEEVTLTPGSKAEFELQGAS